MWTMYGIDIKTMRPYVTLIAHVSFINVGIVIGLILGLHLAKEKRRYKVTPSLIGWAQT